MYQDNWILIDGILSRIVTWGTDIGDLKFDQDLLLVIPGNPGISDFYIDFLTQLHKLVGIPVWMISHAGHDTPPKNEFKNYRYKMFDLQNQIDHKESIIRKYVPDGIRVHVIGHSMGAKISLELLKIPGIEEKIQKCYMLFPTVERIGDSPNAQFIKPFIKYFGTVVIFLSWIFTLFPAAIQSILLEGTFKLTHGASNDCTINGGKKLIQPQVLRNIFHLAKDEMVKIKELDSETLKKHKNRFKFYFGAKDGWSPLKFYSNLIKEVPGIDAEVCNKGIQHAFTIQSASVMSEIISDWIKQSLK